MSQQDGVQVESEPREEDSSHIFTMIITEDPECEDLVSTDTETVTEDTPCSDAHISQQEDHYVHENGFSNANEESMTHENNTANEPTSSTTTNDDGPLPPTASSLQLSLKGLLSQSIAKSVFASTDNCNRMLKETVEKKLELYDYKWNQENKANFKMVDLSLPESYSMKLKSDKGLMEAIFKLIFSRIESIDELVLPELDIESLCYLICDKVVLDGVSKCSSVKILFASKSSEEIQENLPKVVSHLAVSLKSSCISCQPDSKSLLLFESNVKSKEFCRLKKEIKRRISNDLIRVTYHEATICKGLSKPHGTKRKLCYSTFQGTESTAGPSTKKTKQSHSSKKKSLPRLPPVPTGKGDIKFTFDSLNDVPAQQTPQQNLISAMASSAMFTAYEYWQLEKVHGIEGAMGEGTTIAIVDGGIDPSHPAFSTHQIYFEDFNDNTINPSANDHGTSCAGIACGNSFPSVLNPLNESSQDIHCPAGVAPKAKLMVFKVQIFGETYACYETVLHALLRISELVKSGTQINVVNMSLGSLHFSFEIAQVINELVSRNVIVVCAASNLGHKFSQPISFPARLGHVLCIGSHGPHGKPSVFSPVGQQIDFLAPGEEIAAPASGHINHHFCIHSGTSFATPAVSGLICLILGFIKHHYPDYADYFQNQWVMKEVLREISTSPGRHSDDQGFGALNPLQFFQQPDSVLRSLINSIIVRH